MKFVTLPTGGERKPVNLDNVTYMDGYIASDGEQVTEIYFVSPATLTLPSDQSAIWVSGTLDESGLSVSASLDDVIAFIHDVVGPIPDFSVWQRKRAAREQGVAIG